jgi:mannitol/fructose-specific phosphotransferase system IIA component
MSNVTPIEWKVSGVTVTVYGIAAVEDSEITILKTLDWALPTASVTVSWWDDTEPLGTWAMPSYDSMPVSVP